MSSSASSSAMPGRPETPAPGPRSRGSLARALLVVLVPLILGPLVLFAVLSFRQAQSDISNLVTGQVTALISIKDSQIDQWAAARVADVNNLARAPDLVALVRRGGLDEANRPALVERLNHFLLGNSFYEAIMLAEPLQGEVVASTLQFQYDRFLGERFLTPAQLNQVAQRGALMLPPIFEPRVNDVQVLVVAPMHDEAGNPLALVLGFVRDEQLLDIVAPSPGLGRTGRAYVVTSDGYQLGSFVTSQTTADDSEGIYRARMEHQNGLGIYTDQAGNQVFGAYRWLPEYQMALLVEQQTSEAFAPLQRSALALGGIALAAVAAAAAGVVFVARQYITRPLAQLTESAMRLAGGDLTSMVPVTRRDEVGTLGEAFNSMATELRGLYQELEAKVEARTQQLAAAAEVGRAATSILATDELLARTVDLIRDRFGYYHVSVFLLDDTGRWAVIQESTGEVGAMLKARGHRLAVGSNSLIGWVTANRRARIALDVGGDEFYFQNELLPDTRSEAALPLRVGDRIIGALDVQSRSLNAFNQADIEVLQVLADQIAVAVENGRLFAQQERLAQLEQRVAALTARLHRSLTVEGILESATTDLGELFNARKVVVRLAPEAHAVLADPFSTGEAGGSNGNGNGRQSAG